MVTGKEILMFVTYTSWWFCLFTCLAMTLQLSTGSKVEEKMQWPPGPSLPISCKREKLQPVMSLQKFHCDVMADTQLSWSLDEQILRWQVCLECFRRHLWFSEDFTLNGYSTSTLTVLGFPKCKTTCSHCLKN